MGFADDGALCFRGICPHTLIQIAQPFLDKAVEWGPQNGLTFFVDRTTTVFCTRKYNFHSKEINNVKKLTMNGVEIIPSDSMTYLGVVLDKKNWIGTHISRQRFLNVANSWQCSGLPLNITGVCPLKKSSGSGNK